MMTHEMESISWAKTGQEGKWTVSADRISLVQVGPNRMQKCQVLNKNNNNKEEEEEEEEEREEENEENLAAT